MPLLNIKDMKVVSPSPDNFILDLEISSSIDPTVHNYKYIASGEHIYQNNDGIVDNELLDEHVAHSITIKNSKNIYFSKNDGIYISNCGHNTKLKFDWQPYYLQGKVIYSIIKFENTLYILSFEKAVNSRYYVGLYKFENNNLIYLSDSKDKTPIVLSSPFLTFSIVNPSLIYIAYASENRNNQNAIVYPGIYKVTDNGTTWSLLAHTPGKNLILKPTVIGIKNTDTVFTIDENRFLWKSDDQGDNWTKIGDTTTVPNGMLSTLDGNIMYVVSDTDLYKSSDGGNSWSRIQSFELDGNLKSYIYMIDNDKIFIKQNNNIFFSLDGGITWKKLKLQTNNDYIGESFIAEILPMPIYSLFDMNDMAITTSYDGKNQIDNILTLPNANDNPNDRKNNSIEMHSINCNAIYGYIPTKQNASFGFPVYDKLNKKFIMSTHNYNATAKSNETLGKTDTLTLYHYRKNATNISGILGLGHQADIDQSEIGFDKMFVFDPTNDNTGGFEDTCVDWRKYQTNDSDYSINKNLQNSPTNCFDDGMLLARAILFPKQTLNNEYSTERNKNYFNENNITKKLPFHYTRKYNWDKSHFYSNGTHIVLNHSDISSINFSKSIPYIGSSQRTGGTMVTSTYSRRFPESSAIEHKNPEPPTQNSYNIKNEDGSTTTPSVDYNTYGTVTFIPSNIVSDQGLYNQYSPELINRENETQSDTTLMTSKHKTNIFDIDIKSLWDDIVSDFTKEQNEHQETDISVYTEIKSNLKSIIKSNLFKLVEEIKPAHTKLYKIEMGKN